MINFEGKIYHTPEDFRSFLLKEYNFWQFLFNVDQTNFKKPTKDILGRIQLCFNPLKKLYDLLQAHPSANAQQIDSFIQSIRTSTQRDQAQRLDPYFIFLPPPDCIEKVKSYYKNKQSLTEPDVYWLAYHFNFSLINNLSLEEFKGYLVAWADDYGFNVSHLKEQKESCKHLEEDLQELLNKKIEVDSLVQQANILEKELKDATTEQSEKFKGFIGDKSADFQAFKKVQETAFKKDLDHLKQTIQDQFNSIEKTFEAKLALLAPVKYWTKLQAKFANNARWYGGTSVVLAVLVIIGLFCFFGHYGDQKLTDLTLYHFVIIPVSLIFIWIIRILVRCFLTNLHLLNDTKFKAVMVNTYLALGKKGLALDGKNEQLILSALFATPKTGLVKDDGAPITFLEKFLNKS